MTEAVRIAHVPVHALDISAAIRVIDEFISSGTPHYNIAINAAKVVEFQGDPVLRDSIEGAHLLTADGQSVVWASRILGQPLPARVAGIDLMQALLCHADQRRYSIYLLGARDEVVSACVEEIRAMHKNVRVAGYRNGYFGPRDEPNVIRAIRDAKPDILFLGFGTPAKEYFMHKYYRELGVPFVMGVGGTFDVLAGVTKRAPRWMQNAGLEWGFRLLQEPKRMWKRYLVGNTTFALLVARDVLNRRSR